MNSHNLKVAKKIKDIDEETHYIDLDCIVVKIFPKREHILIDTGLVGDSVDSIVKGKGNGPYDKRHNRSLNIVIADKDNLNSQIDVFLYDDFADLFEFLVEYDEFSISGSNYSKLSATMKEGDLITKYSVRDLVNEGNLQVYKENSHGESDYTLCDFPHNLICCYTRSNSLSENDRGEKIKCLVVGEENLDYQLFYNPNIDTFSPMKEVQLINGMNEFTLVETRYETKIIVKHPSCTKYVCVDFDNINNDENCRINFEEKRKEFLPSVKEFLDQKQDLIILKKKILSHDMMKPTSEEAITKVSKDSQNINKEYTKSPNYKRPYSSISDSQNNDKQDRSTASEDHEKIDFSSNSIKFSEQSKTIIPTIPHQHKGGKMSFYNIDKAKKRIKEIGKSKDKCFAFGIVVSYTAPRRMQNGCWMLSITIMGSIDYCDKGYENQCFPSTEIVLNMFAPISSRESKSKQAKWDNQSSKQDIQADLANLPSSLAVGDIIRVKCMFNLHNGKPQLLVEERNFEQSSILIARRKNKMLEENLENSDYLPYILDEIDSLPEEDFERYTDDNSMNSLLKENISAIDASKTSNSHGNHNNSSSEVISANDFYNYNGSSQEVHPRYNNGLDDFYMFEESDEESYDEKSKLNALNEKFNSIEFDPNDWEINVRPKPKNPYFQKNPCDLLSKADKCILNRMAILSAMYLSTSILERSNSSRNCISSLLYSNINYEVDLVVYILNVFERDGKRQMSIWDGTRPQDMSLSQSSRAPSSVVTKLFDIQDAVPDGLRDAYKDSKVNAKLVDYTRRHMYENGALVNLSMDRLQWEHLTYLISVKSADTLKGKWVRIKKPEIDAQAYRISVSRDTKFMIIPETSYDVSQMVKNYMMQLIIDWEIHVQNMAIVEKAKNTLHSNNIQPQIKSRNEGSSCMEEIGNATPRSTIDQYKVSTEPNYLLSDGPKSFESSTSSKGNNDESVSFQWVNALQANKEPGCHWTGCEKVYSIVKKNNPNFMNAYEALQSLPRLDPNKVKTYSKLALDEYNDPVVIGQISKVLIEKDYSTNYSAADILSLHRPKDEKKWIYNVKIKVTNPEDRTEADALLGKHLKNFAVFENYQPSDLISDEDKLKKVNSILKFWESEKPLITFTIASGKRTKNQLHIKRFLYVVKEDVDYWNTREDRNICPN